MELTRPPGLSATTERTRLAWVAANVSAVSAGVAMVAAAAVGEATTGRHTSLGEVVAGRAARRSGQM